MATKRLSVVMLGSVAAAVTAIAALVSPRASIAGILLGFAIVIANGLIAMFKRHPAGPFAQWIEPGRFYRMEFSSTERMVFAVGIGIVVGGAIALAWLILVAD